MSDAKKPLDLSQFEPFPNGWISYLPSFVGDGFNIGGGIIVTIGQTAIPLGGLDAMRGYLPEQLALAKLIANAPALLSEVIALRAALRKSNSPSCGGCLRFDPQPCEPGCVVAEALGEGWRGE